MNLEDAREGRRYRVTWKPENPNDGGAEGAFTAVLLLKTFTPSLIPSTPGPFLGSVTWDNGVMTGGYGYEAEEVAR